MRQPHRHPAPALALAIVLAACSRAPEPTGPGAAPGPAAPATAQLAAMPEQALRQAARQALADNRIYTPAGDNAAEYYLALRAQHPEDASVTSALTDLQPYLQTAVEQAATQDDEEEATRLLALIARIQPNAPALPRLRSAMAQPGAPARPPARPAPAGTATPPTSAPPPPPHGQAGVEATTGRATQAPGAALPSLPATAPVPTLKPLRMQPPRYPAQALRSGIGGEVLVEFTVGTDGAVIHARIVQATPSRVFDREALAAVKRWTFEPVPAPVTARRTLAFTPGR